MKGITELFSSDWRKLVFENRNHAYGAYELRRLNDRNTMLGLLLGIFFFGMIILIPFGAQFFSSDQDHTLLKNQEVYKLTEVILPVLAQLPPEAPAPVLKSSKSTVNAPPKIVASNEKIAPQAIIEATSSSTKGTEQPVTTTISNNTVKDVVEVAVVDNKTFESYELDVLPEFPGGEKELLNFISKNIRYPQLAKEAGVSGKVYLTFVVEATGKVAKVTLFRGIGAGCDEEAIRVVRMLPDFKPGLKKGAAVPVLYKLPINFVLR